VTVQNNCSCGSEVLEHHVRTFFNYSAISFFSFKKNVGGSSDRVPPPGSLGRKSPMCCWVILTICPFLRNKMGTNLETIQKSDKIFAQGDKTMDRGQNLWTGDKTGDTQLGTGDKTWVQTKKRLNLVSRDKTGIIHFGDLAIIKKKEFVISNDRQETYWGYPAE
jgi:hypothetical protein